MSRSLGAQSGLRLAQRIGEKSTPHPLMEKRKVENENLTDYQLDKILQLVFMILDGCSDLAEAKEKIAQLCK